MITIESSLTRIEILFLNRIIGKPILGEFFLIRKAGTFFSPYTYKEETLKNEYWL